MFSAAVVTTVTPTVDGVPTGGSAAASAAVVLMRYSALWVHAYSTKVAGPPGAAGVPARAPGAFDSFRPRSDTTVSPVVSRSSDAATAQLLGPSANTFTCTAAVLPSSDAHRRAAFSNVIARGDEPAVRLVSVGTCARREDGAPNDAIAGPPGSPAPHATNKRPPNSVAPRVSSCPAPLVDDVSSTDAALPKAM